MTATAHAPEEFRDEKLRAVVHRKEACRVEVEVFPAASMVEEARRSAIKVVNKQISVAGFRKGKAPEGFILQKYTPQVEKELHQQLANLAYPAAQHLARIPVLNNNGQISFQMKKLESETAHLLFSFETEPVVPPIDPNQFERQEGIARAEVGLKQIDEAITQMRYFYAEWRPIEDRPIENGDTIMINLEALEEGGEYRLIFDHVRFELSKERMAEWMQNLVQGAKAGDVLEGTSEPDEQMSEEDKQEFKPKKVRLTIVRAEQAILPPLDDEFAKKVGAPDVETMRQTVTKMLTNQADEGVVNSLRKQVTEFFLTKVFFEIPKTLIEAEKKHRLQRLVQDEKFKARLPQMSPSERKTLEEKLEAESNKAIRLFYISRQIVRDAKLSITHKEVEDEAVATLRSWGSDKIDTIPKEVFALALSEVMLTKAQDYILAQKA